jgi:hypothetical protein
MTCPGIGASCLGTDIREPVIITCGAAVLAGRSLDEGGETMSGLHGTLGYLTIVAAIVVAVAAGTTSVGLQRRWGRSLARLTDVLAIVVSALVLAALFIGGLLLITGLRPMSPAHILLAVAALTAVPVAAGVGLWREHGAGRGPARYGWLAGGAAVTAVLGLLLAASG